MCFGFKKPKTTNERRKTQCRGHFLLEDDYYVKIRANRNCKNLPNAWDDIPTHRIIRNWKIYRKTQYK